MSLIRRDVIQGVQRVLIAVLVVIALAVITLGMHAIWTWGDGPRRDPAALAPSATPLPAAESTPTPASGERPRPTRAIPGGNTGILPVQRRPRVGIVVGHWQSDSGALCDDGLAEVEINYDVAQLVVAMLGRSGYDVDMMAEFDPQLAGYEADALVSIHTDSCNVPEATGFKVARVSSSQVPELEDLLVASLIEKYQQATGLQFHRNSITYDMTEYHAFYEIAPETPAAIIEIGFMAADRRLLTKKQDRVAEGIVNGIKTFIDRSR
jgi:N-acetylmuramoyl-L-alanine amidase